MYVSRQVTKPEEGDELVPWPLNGSPELGAKLAFDPSWGKTEANYYAVCPGYLLIVVVCARYFVHVGAEFLK